MLTECRYPSLPPDSPALTPHSLQVPEELFGPLSMRALEEDKYIRQTSGWVLLVLLPLQHDEERLCGRRRTREHPGLIPRLWSSAPDLLLSAATCAKSCNTVDKAPSMPC